jgi:tetratricopeptide (TPR) repeat protein
VVADSEFTPGLGVALSCEPLIIARAARLSWSTTGPALDALNGALSGREVTTFERSTEICSAVRRWVEARRVGVPTAVESTANTPLAKEREAAKLLFASGNLSAAVLAYETVIAESDRFNLPADLHAGRLGLALALLALGRLDDARAVARTLDAGQIATQALLTSVRLLTALELKDEAIPFVAALGNDPELRAFNALLVNTVPGSPPQSPDLVMQGVALLTEEHRFGTAADWLEKSFEKASKSALISVSYIERIAVLLDGWSWTPPGDDPLAAATITRLLNKAQALGASLKRGELSDNVNIRLLRAELGLAITTFDEQEERVLTAKLSALTALPTNDIYAVALKTALRGNLDEAMSLLGTMQPEWRGRMQRLNLRFLSGNIEEATDELLALALEHPNVPVIHGELTRRLVETDRIRDALPIARQSYRLLPGIGQGMYLAHTLIVSGQSDEAESLLREIGSPDPRLAGLLAQSIESRHILEALALWDRYLDAFPSDWRSQRHVIDLMARASRLDMACERAWTLVERDVVGAPAELLLEAAILQFAFGPETQRTERITWLWMALDQRPAGDAATDRAKLLIWLHLSANVPLPRPAFEGSPAGGATEIESAEAKMALADSLRHARDLRKLYDLGHVAVLCSFPTISEDPASYVHSLGVSNHLPSGERTPDRAPALSATSCVHLGVLEILALIRLTSSWRWMRGSKRVFDSMCLTTLSIR